MRYMRRRRCRTMGFYRGGVGIRGFPNCLKGVVIFLGLLEECGSAESGGVWYTSNAVLRYYRVARF